MVEFRLCSALSESNSTKKQRPDHASNLETDSTVSSKVVPPNNSRLKVTVSERRPFKIDHSYFASPGNRSVVTKFRKIKKGAISRVNHYDSLLFRV